MCPPYLLCPNGCPSSAPATSQCLQPPGAASRPGLIPWPDLGTSAWPCQLWATKSPSKLPVSARLSLRPWGRPWLRQPEPHGGGAVMCWAVCPRWETAAAWHTMAPEPKLCLSFPISHLPEPVSAAHSPEDAMGQLSISAPLGAPARSPGTGDLLGVQVAPSPEGSSVPAQQLSARVCTISNLP